MYCAVPYTKSIFHFGLNTQKWETKHGSYRAQKATVEFTFIRLLHNWMMCAVCVCVCTSAHLHRCESDKFFVYVANRWLPVEDGHNTLDNISMCIFIHLFRFIVAYIFFILLLLLSSQPLVAARSIRMKYIDKNELYVFRQTNERSDIIDIEYAFALDSFVPQPN